MIKNLGLPPCILNNTVSYNIIYGIIHFISCSSMQYDSVMLALGLPGCILIQHSLCCNVILLSRLLVYILYAICACEYLKIASRHILMLKPCNLIVQEICMLVGMEERWKNLKVR